MVHLVIISLVEPLGGVLGESASIFCQIHGLGGASGIVLRDATAETIVETGPTERLNLGFLNATHREFILDEVRMSDDGREFICSLQEFFSPPVTFIVNRKSAIISTSDLGPSKLSTLDGCSAQRLTEQKLTILKLYIPMSR